MSEQITQAEWMNRMQALLDAFRVQVKIVEKYRTNRSVRRLEARREMSRIRNEARQLAELHPQPWKVTTRLHRLFPEL